MLLLRVGQESFGFSGRQAGHNSSLDALHGPLDWTQVEQDLLVLPCAVRGEASWPPLAMLKALLLQVWYDLSDVKLAEASDDRASFRRFCGFAGAVFSSGVCVFP